MSFRITGLVPALALLAVGVAHAQQAPTGTQQSTTGGGGGMAYPDSAPSGQVRIPAPTARDTGSMAYPTSPGGVVTQAPTGRDTGSMALPTTGGSVTRTRPARMAGRTAGGVPMAPAVTPTAGSTAAAAQMADQPSSAPVPYTDFDPPAATARRGAMRHMPMHRAVMRRAAPHRATPAAATATPAPATATPTATPAK